MRPSGKRPERRRRYEYDREAAVVEEVADEIMRHAYTLFSKKTCRLMLLHNLHRARCAATAHERTTARKMANRWREVGKQAPETIDPSSKQP